MLRLKEAVFKNKCIISEMVPNYVLIIIVIIGLAENVEGQVQRPNPFHFPYGMPSSPFMGLFLAISVPIDLPNNNVYLSYYFEANYNLPINETEYEYPPIITDRALEITRKYAYDALEHKIKSHGYPGKECLLRTICEAAIHSLDHNGVLGDLVYILLAPSTSKSEALLHDYDRAEQYGLLKKHCKRYIRECSISLLGFISWIAKAIP